MNTPSHLIMTAAVHKGLRRVPIARLPFLLGAVAPDLPLLLLSIGGGLFYRYIRGLSPAATFRHLYDTMYFNDPLWIAGHNLLHAPLLLLLALALLWPYRYQTQTRQQRWFWFFAACALHSAVDILTHVDDGPLLLFPFEWSIRFASPVSYWDRRHYGAQFALFELTLDLVLLSYLLLPAIWRELRRRLALSRGSEAE